MTVLFAEPSRCRMLFVVAFELAASDCATYDTGVQQSFTVSAGCVEVYRCYFRNETEGAIGAIYVQSGADSLAISETTFIACHATEYGGAVCCDCGNCSIARCCGVECYSVLFGQFLSFGGSGSTPRNMSFLTIVDCAPWDHFSMGVIYVDREVPLNHSNINFTNCRAGYGSMIRSNHVDSSVGATFVTAVACSGRTGIDSLSRTVAFISMCNFYDSNLWQGVIYSREVGLQIISCIFNGNSSITSQDISCSADSLSTRITVANCVFSGAQPSYPDAVYSIDTNNVWEAVTLSYNLSLLDTIVCPTTLSASPTRSGTRTRLQSLPESTLPQTPSVTNSPSPSDSETQNPSGSRSQSPSVAHSATKEPSESSGPPAEVGGGAKPPVGAIVGGICGAIGVLVISGIVYVLLRRRSTGSYDARSGADGGEETHDIEFVGDTFEQTTLVTFHDETTIAGTEAAVFKTDATETFGGDLASVMGI